MKKLFLHIGQPKTGTSAIQQFCHRNEDKLRARSIEYIKYGRDTLPLSHKYLWLSFLDFFGTQASAYHQIGHLTVPTLETALADLRQEIASSSCDRFVISFEAFSAVVLYPDKAEEALILLREALADVCDISIICYFRDPWEVLLSNYNQRCKSSPLTAPFIDWVMGGAIKTLNQKELYDTYSKVFDHIFAKRYGAAKGIDFLAEFLEVLGEGITGLELVENVNASLPVEDLETLRIKLNLGDSVPSTHTERFIYGGAQPRADRWDNFLMTLENINTDNAALFKELFNKEPKSISIADLIWTERKINHRIATQTLLSQLLE